MNEIELTLEEIAIDGSLFDFAVTVCYIMGEAEKGLYEASGAQITPNEQPTCSIEKVYFDGVDIMLANILDESHYSYIRDEIYNREDNEI